MAAYEIFDDVDLFPWDDFREDSRQLEEFRTGNFSSIATELSELITDDDEILLTHVPLAGTYCVQKSPHYAVPPQRTFSGGRKAQLEALAALYKRNDFNGALLEGTQQAAAHNSVIFIPEPASHNRLQLLTKIPADFLVECNSNPHERDLRYADKITVRWPVHVSATEVVYGRRIYTPEEIYTEGPGGDRKPVFGDSFSNPFDFLPVCGYRLQTGLAGWWVPALNQALGSTQIGLTVTLSDALFIARYQCHGREVLEGPGAKNAIMKGVMSGPRRLMVFDPGTAATPGLTYKIINARPEIQKYLDAATTIVKLFAAYERISVEGLAPSSGRTGDAKEVEREGEIADRLTRENGLGVLEQQLAEVSAAVGNIGPRALELPRSVEVSMRYRYVRPLKNDLQLMQALAIKMALGLTSREELVAEFDHIVGEDEIADLIVKRAESYAKVLEELKGKSIAGLDSVASYAGLQADAPPPPAQPVPAPMEGAA